MTNGALDCLALATRADERLAFLNTPVWHIRDEMRTRIAADKLFQVLRHLNNAKTDGLRFPSLQISQVPAVNVGLGHRVRFNDLDNWFQFQSRKVSSRLFSLLSGGGFREFDHS